METVNQLPQIEWTSETPTYDAVSPSKSEAWDELDISNGNIARRFRLSRSPLDSLQMEFKRYGKPDARAKDSLVCIISSHPYSRPHRMFEPIRDLALAVYLRKALGCVMHYRGLRDLRLTPSRIFYRPIVSRAHKSSRTLTNWTYKKRATTGSYSQMISKTPRRHLSFRIGALFIDVSKMPSTSKTTIAQA